MIAGILLIRYNLAIASRLTGPSAEPSLHEDALTGLPAPQVLIGGYGRVGHTIAVLLKSSGVAFVAFDTDPKRVQQGRADGFFESTNLAADRGLCHEQIFCGQCDAHAPADSHKAADQIERWNFRERF